MDQKRIKEAQKILDWAIMNLNGSIKCKVDGYKDEKYPVRFFTKENVLIDAINVPQEWIEDTSPKENCIRDELKSLLRDLGQKAKRERR